MIATKVGAGPSELAPGVYACGRCGRVSGYRVSRGRPEVCGDCLSVERYREPEPLPVKPVREFPTHLSDEECLAARRAVRAGDRSPEVVLAAREYWRRLSQRRKAVS